MYVLLSRRLYTLDFRFELFKFYKHYKTSVGLADVELLVTIYPLFFCDFIKVDQPNKTFFSLCLCSFFLKLKIILEKYH